MRKGSNFAQNETGTGTAGRWYSRWLHQKRQSTWWDINAMTLNAPNSTITEHIGEILEESAAAYIVWRTTFSTCGRRREGGPKGRRSIL